MTEFNSEVFFFVEGAIKVYDKSGSPKWQCSARNVTYVNWNEHNEIVLHTCDGSQDAVAKHSRFYDQAWLPEHFVQLKMYGNTMFVNRNLVQEVKCNRTGKLTIHFETIDGAGEEVDLHLGSTSSVTPYLLELLGSVDCRDTGLFRDRVEAVRDPGTALAAQRAGGASSVARVSGAKRNFVGLHARENDWQRAEQRLPEQVHCCDHNHQTPPPIQLRKKRSQSPDTEAVRKLVNARRVLVLEAPHPPLSPPMSREIEL